MISNTHFRIDTADHAHGLWIYIVAASGHRIPISPPVFEIDGVEVTASVMSLEASGEAKYLPNEVSEFRVIGPLDNDPDLSLEIVYHIAATNPIVRVRYILHSARNRRLTRAAGHDRMTYLGLSLKEYPVAKEIRLSEFNKMVHSFCLSEQSLETHDFDAARSVMGPLLTGEGQGHALVLAYEHGSQLPDAFLRYDLEPNREVRLRAVKGSYVDGQPLDTARSYATLWMQLGAVKGTEEQLARAFRESVLKHLSANQESRQPSIFYNTWAFQERNRWWYKQAYLDSMNEERILAEIDVAHRMGIDVFVLDTGWYEKTGDWRVSTKRFPHGLGPVKAKLDAYGMKLGLWFDPLAAAVSSKMLTQHPDCLMSWNGNVSEPHPVWETEASQRLCLVSRYRDAFAEELIRLVKEVGVSYFKWDAIGQYGCNDPHHEHGTLSNTPQERADSYAFQLGACMAEVVDKLCAVYPEAIVDFDITEGGRSVGLQFLSAGKYFLINNGPYNYDFNMPVPADGNVNLFFFPGPARSWICRFPLTYDKWIPSVLFLTHYLPDDPADNQWISLASLVLGQNGIWGDLLNVSEEGVKRFGDTLRLYKQIKADITAGTLRRTGEVSGSPEVYEKINSETGHGVLSLFASAPGRYTYVTSTHSLPRKFWHNDGVTVTHDEQGRARIEADFTDPGAKIVFFGVEP